MTLIRTLITLAILTQHIRERVSYWRTFPIAGNTPNGETPR